MPLWLDLEAQRKAVAAYAANADLTSVDELTELETGKGTDVLEERPVFAAAALEQRVAQRLRAGELRELATKAQISSWISKLN